MIRTADGQQPQTPKARMLARAARAGLPVPEGFVIAHDADQSQALHFEALQTEALQTEALKRMVATVQGLFAVRSSFDAEDTDTTSAAGRFRSELDVSASALATAIDRVRQSADDTVTRADVLVMQMVDAHHAGVAVLEDAYLDDLVEVVDGLAEGLVGGTREGQRVNLPRLDRDLGADLGPDLGLDLKDGEGWRGRLAVLLRDVRHTFGRGNAAGWDVEWADDGSRCWLVQIRPLLRPVVRNDLLTLANHAEILPDLPSTFMTSLIIQAGPGGLEWYTSLDPRLPTSRDLMIERAGRPLLNLSLLTDILRTWGLPTSLLADSMGGMRQTAPASANRLIRSAPVLARVAMRQLRAVGDARTRGQKLRERAEVVAGAGTDTAERMSTAVDAAVDIYTGLITGMFSLANAHAAQVAALSRMGLLDQVQRRAPTPAGSLIRDLDDGLALEALLRRHGHRGVYESDLARPRYAEAPEMLEQAQELHAGRPRTAEGQHTLAGTAVMPLWLSARRSLAARERLRDDGMRAFAVIRARLLAVAEDLLEDPEHLWLLTVEEARQLDAGWRPDQAFISDRRSVRESQRSVHLADPIGRTDALDSYSKGPNTSGEGGEGDDTAPLSGRPLVGGRVRGTAWVCDEPPVGDPPADGPIILVARAVDGGWVGAFGRVDAVVLHLGGDLSHGALILREMGVPTLTGVVDVQRRVRTGQTLVVDATAGLLIRQG